MGMILGIVGLIALIVNLVCFVMILIKMFQTDDTTMGIVCIATFFLCFGIGGLIAFVMGWINVAKYNAQQLMTAWTVAFVLSLALNVASFATGGVNLSL